MKKTLLIFLVIAAAFLLISMTEAEARQKHISNPKNGEDIPLYWSVEMENPSNVTFDSVSNGYYITDYGKYGYYPHFLPADLDTSYWDGAIYFVSNEDHSMYKLPILVDNPSGLEIVGDTLYVSDRWRLFLINLNNDSLMATYFFNEHDNGGLTDMCKDTSGFLYISSWDADSIFRYNIATRQIISLQLSGTSFDSLGSMVFEPRDNAIYFGCYKSNSKIMKLRLDSLIVSLAKQTVIPYISGMDTDEEGNLYVTQNRWLENWGSDIIKFNRNFIGDSTIIIHYNFNAPNNNIYFKKNDNIIVLTEYTKNRVVFQNLSISQDSVKLVYPKDSAVNVETHIEFKFNRLFNKEGIDTYELYCSTFRDFSDSTEMFYISPYDSSIVLNCFDTSRTYYWLVRARSGKVYSQLSKVFMFTTRGQKVRPTAIYPTDNQTGVYSNVNFRWTETDNAKEYLFRAYTDLIGFNIFYEARTDTNALLVDDFDTETDYWWNVKAIGDSAASNWSEIYQFTTDTATLNYTYPITPVNGLDSCETQFDFIWEPVPGATHYIYKLCNALDDVLVKYYLDTNAVTVANLDSLTMYNWYIKSYNSQGTSAWNFSPYQFRTGNNLPPPPKINPVSADGKPVDVNPLFTWQDMGATTYKIQIAEIKKDPITGIESADFLHPVFGTDNVPSNNFKLSSNLANDKQYAWKVKSIYTKKRRSNWSEINQFTTKSLVDVDESDYGKTISLNPSIFSNEIFIRLPENFGFIQKYEVYDMHGELILSGDVFDNEREISLNTYLLNDGLYLIRIKTNKGNYEIKGLKVR